MFRRNTKLRRHTIRFACVAVGALLVVSIGRAEEIKPLPHVGAWPIQHGHNLQPRADQLKAMQREDLTPQESREVDRLYQQLEDNSREMLENRHLSR